VQDKQFQRMTEKVLSLTPKIVISTGRRSRGVERSVKQDELQRAGKSDLEGNSNLSNVASGGKEETE